ncbi:MAG: amino acid permease [Pirellulaceae bacterium]|nr:amino acid permease [Pirellulaceae bacterium]
MSGTDAKPIEPTPSQALSLADSTAIIVGIIIGSGIYEIAQLVAGTSGGFGARLAPTGWEQTAAWGAILGVWLLGGLIALVGAMCYAELATAFPQAGGTYVFLSRGLGRSVGFSFAWAEFWIVRPGNVGAIAFVLARYAAQLLPEAWSRSSSLQLGIATGAIVVISVLNAIGLQAGKWTQNVLTAAKLVGLAIVILTALTLRPAAGAALLPAGSTGNLTLALILVMFAYGGWSDMSFVAAEVRDPRRNIFRALLLGTVVVAAIYLAINFAFLLGLGAGGLVRSDAAAAEVMSGRFGALGSTAISLLVVISCLSSLNGLLFTGARVYYALGTEHPVFRWLGSWDEQKGVPLRSLVVQTIVTLGLVVMFGRDPQGFERLVVFTAPFYWGFISLVGVALVVIRLRGLVAEGTFRVPLFPLSPLFFFATSGAMVVAAVQYAASKISQETAWQVAWAAVVLATGIAVGFWDWRAGGTSSPAKHR